MDAMLLEFLRSLIPFDLGFGHMFKDLLLLLITGNILATVLSAKNKYRQINLFGKAKND